MSLGTPENSAIQKLSIIIIKNGPLGIGRSPDEDKGRYVCACFQLDVYRTLKKSVSGEAVSIANDFRPVQELHERRVTSNDKRVLQYMSADILKELRGDIGKLEERCTNDARAVTSSFWVTYCLLVLLLRLTMEMM